MKEKSCCFSGHRKISAENIDQIKRALDIEIENLIHDGYTDFCVGGALGFDMFVEERVIIARETHPQIRLVLFLPCKDQSKNWRDEEQAKYTAVINEADKILYTTEKYEQGCTLKRNRQMIDTCSICVCYMKNKHSGTAYTVRYAKENGVAVINLADRI